VNAPRNGAVPREKSTSATVERNLAEIEQRVQILSSQIHILNDQFTAQLIATPLDDSISGSIARSER
jgi:hypothetical protein